MLESAMLVVPARGRGDDRALLRRIGDAVLFAVADGAGGTSNGSAAADALVALVGARSADLVAGDEERFVLLLEEADATCVAASGGETTGVVGVARAGAVVGASVGDSGAVLFRPSPFELTAGQSRKPLLGSGKAHPRGFDAAWSGEPLIAATDGLLRFAATGALAAGLATIGDPDSTARRLVDLARLRSGALSDDVALVLVRSARAP